MANYRTARLGFYSEVRKEAHGVRSSSPQAFSGRWEGVVVLAPSGTRARKFAARMGSPSVRLNFTLRVDFPSRALKPVTYGAMCTFHRCFQRGPSSIPRPDSNRAF